MSMQRRKGSNKVLCKEALPQSQRPISPFYGVFDKGYPFMYL